jgi:hypothetical protein
VGGGEVETVYSTVVGEGLLVRRRGVTVSMAACVGRRCEEAFGFCWWIRRRLGKQGMKQAGESLSIRKSWEPQKEKVMNRTRGPAISEILYLAQFVDKRLSWCSPPYWYFFLF